MPVRVLFAASECAPFVKTGGFADVVGALPPALRALGHDVRLLVPGYPAVLAGAGATRDVATIGPFAELPGARLVAGTTPSGVPLLAVVNDELYDRPGGPYQGPDGIDFEDNARRFGLLSHVTAALASPGSPIRWKPQVVHAHDWQTGLAPAYLALWGDARAASVITIHNLAFQGVFDPSWLAPLGIPASAYAMHGVEYFGQLSFLKAALFSADAITTVSPTYAREIRDVPLGMGLEGLLAERAADLHGIQNGIDVEAWDPATDPHLPVRYRGTTLWRKAGNKAALQAEFGLAVRDDVPLFAIVSRLTQQKVVKGQINAPLLERSIRYAIERKKSEEDIYRMAYYDVLTNLPNRLLYNDRLRQAIALAERHNRMLAILFLDLDNFKRINDTFGHHMGDQLLKGIAERLQQSMRKCDSLARQNIDGTVDTIARLGGDEFTIILSEIKHVEDAAKVAQRILPALSQQFMLSNYEIYISASAGIVVYPDDGRDSDSLLKNADAAMYHANAEGKNNYQYYRNSMNASAFQRLTMENDMRKALEQKATEFSGVLKMGRTENQDAVPMTLGQEFGAYGRMIESASAALQRAAEELHDLNMGATAIGTGINSPPGYAERVTKLLAEVAACLCARLKTSSRPPRTPAASRRCPAP